MRKIFLIIISFTTLIARGQVVTTLPALPRADQPVTITIDVSGTSLSNFDWNNTTDPVWLWAWISNGSNSIDAPTNVNPATTPAQDAAKCTRINTNLYQITITPTTFFNKPSTEILRVGLKLKSRNWSDNKQSDNDRFITFAQGFDLVFSKPAEKNSIKGQGEQLEIIINLSQNADVSLKINDQQVASATQVSTLTYTHTTNESPGTLTTILCQASNPSETISKSITYVIRTATVNEQRPITVIDGINYNASNTSSVTLGLWAPGKSSVYLLGDFNDWSIHPSYQMKKDGEHFWLPVSGLTPGIEYAYQYFVDENIYVADPYAQTILDPDDQYITPTTYPDLKKFPTKALQEKWYFNRVGTLKTGQEQYNWKINDFKRPPKEDLVIYEVLIRDFFGSNARTYQSLTDTLAYFKKLGINAIELMPIMEFNGNESWGYNPTFLFAPDKAYGTANQLKTFIDRCHENGIAVILDIAMNHHDAPNPYLLMDMDFTSFKPTSSNKWFNTEAKHPFNVFFDMNHESSYTQHYLDTVNYYWLHEFNADGFRFDLSKGFTQTNNPSNINAWSNYDASRIALLKRMADKLWSHTPDAYIILEHFAANAEEKELAEYRASEGKGMLLWGNLNNAFSQHTKGISPDADISQAYYTARGWNVPHLITYMESHDEERLMYSNLTGGNASGPYTTRNLQTALKRMQAASLIFYTIPGPKMVWQFGELGYDQSINRCADGSVSTNCRVDAKPVKWDYLANPDRYDLFEHTADLIRLRNTYDVFTRGDADIQGMNSLSKQITLKNKPYHASPLNASDMNVQVAANFNLTSQNLSITFPHTGKWYDYYSNGNEIDVSTIPFPLTLTAGEYKLYTDVKIQNPLLITSVTKNETSGIQCFPNPATDYIQLKPDKGTVDLVLRTLQGVKIHPRKTSSDQWYIGDIAPGLYIAEIVTEQNIHRIKILKK